MNNPQAALIGAGVVSFLPGIPSAQRDTVKLALALAERSTQGDYAEGLVEDWFAYYRNKLKFMGWDALSPEEVHWPRGDREKIVDQSLHAIAATAGTRFSDSTGLALRELMANPSALARFERQAQERQHFQLLPCAPAGNGRVDMVLYHESDTKSVFSAGFLSRKRGHKHVRAELVRFNLRLFTDTFLPTVHRRLVDASRQAITDYLL